MSNDRPSNPGKEVAPPGSNIDTSGHENITVNELDKAFEELETHTVIDHTVIDPRPKSGEWQQVLEGDFYD